MKKRLSLVLIVLLTLGVILTGCASKTETGDKGSDNGAATDDEVITIRISHVLQDTHPTNTTLVDIFKPEVEKNSNGKLKVEIYPNAQLGSDRQAIEAVSLGSLEMSVPGGPVLSGFYEPFMIFDLPFLFKDRQAAYAAMDGELAEKVGEGLLDQNILILGIGENGFRHITNNEGPVYTPDDLKGLKFRTMENPLHIAAFKGMGANPTPIAFGELFTALQQKTVDAQEQPIAILYTSKFNEVQKYLTLDGHVFANCPYIINKDFYEGLSPELQKVIADAVTKTVEVQRKTLAEKEAELIEELKNLGMEVNELTDEQRQLFVEASQPAYDLFIEKFGEQGEELLKLAQSYNK